MNLFFCGCQEPLEDTIPPSIPKWVEKSLPYAWEERGIDAEYVGTPQIKLQWHRVMDEDIAGYRILRRAEEFDTSKFHLIGSIDLLHIIGTDTVFFDSEAEIGKRYAYLIRSIDNAGNLSDPSDTISYMLLNPPRLITPLNETAGSVPTFIWQTFDTQIYWANYFAIRVEDVTDPYDINTIWTCFFLNNWIGLQDPIEFHYLASDSSAWPNNIINCNYIYDALPSGTYRWKVKGIFTVDDEDRDESSGESEWGYFEVK